MQNNKPCLSFSFVRRRILFTFLMFAFLGSSNAIGEEPVRLVFDADWSENGDTFLNSAHFQEDLFLFTASDPQHGGEIWRSDGTAEGSYLLGDLCPGACSGGDVLLDTWIAEFGEEIFFIVRSAPVAGLWRTDGTEAPSLFLNGRIFSLFALDHNLVFVRWDGQRTSLWATDGTFAGTQRLGPASPQFIIPVGGRVFFNTAPGILWTSDGTPAGTHRVADLGADAEIVNMTNLGGLALVQTRRELWMSDGAIARKITTLSETQTLSNSFQDLPTTSTFAYFSVFDSDTGESTIWRTDGSEEGTLPLLPACSGLCDFSFRSIDWTLASDGKLFMLIEGEDNWAFWVSDGTPEGSIRLATVQTQQFPFHLTAIGDRVIYTTMSNFSRTLHLWTSDGTVQGTGVLQVFEESGREVMSFDVLADESRLWFSFNRRTSPDTYVTEVWQSDGINPEAQSRHRIPGRFQRYLGLFQGQLLLALDDGRRGVEPWITDATASGTRLLADINSLEGGLSPTRLLADRSAVYFDALRDFATSLWHSEGTADGTQAAPLFGGASRKQLLPFGERSLVFTNEDTLWSYIPGRERILLRTDIRSPDSWTIRGDQLFFVERREDEIRFWQSDGTVEGTKTVSTFPAESRFSPRNTKIFQAGDIMIFEANEPTGVWRSDGTEAGTFRLDFPFPPSRLMSLGGKVYFMNPERSALWQTDGTQAGTRQTFPFGDIFPGALWYIDAADETIYMVIRPEDGAPSLWRSNGTASGTQKIVDLPSLPQSTFIQDAQLWPLTPVEDGLFFTINEPGFGVELWHADRDGAGKVKDLCPGACSSVPRNPQVIAGRLYFAASDGVNGFEPWTSDGTAEGTYLLADVSPGPRSSNPMGFTGFAGEVYFSAHHPDFGTELWAYDLLGDCSATAERACLNGGRFEVSVDWRSQHGGVMEGTGKTLPFSDQSNFFWFFNPENIELVTKILDGRTINGAYWMFYGALTDVEYWLRARDRLTGREVEFYNPPGEICGAGDILAFPEIETPLTAARALPPENLPSVFPASTQVGDGPGCQSDATTLCLRDGRFRVEVEWRNPNNGALNAGQVIPGTSESGYFWFFNPENLELIVKILDGTSINGKFWVFYGALSDVEYTLTVTDLMTGAVQTYNNPQGEICGVGDTQAFD